MQRVLVCLSEPSSLIEYKQICPFLLNAQWILCTNLFAGSLDRWFAYFFLSLVLPQIQTSSRDDLFDLDAIPNSIFDSYQTLWAHFSILVSVRVWFWFMSKLEIEFSCLHCVFFRCRCFFFVVWIFFLHLNTLFSYMHEWSDCYN